MKNPLDFCSISDSTKAKRSFLVYKQSTLASSLVTKVILMRSSSRWVTQTTTSFLPKFLQVIINNSLDFLYWDFAFQNYFGRHYKMCRLYTSKNVVVAQKFLFCKNLKKLEAWNPKLEFHLPVRTEHENSKPEELEAWKSQAWNISKVSRFFFLRFFKASKIRQNSIQFSDSFKLQ